jgi:hypothetical protein
MKNILKILALAIGISNCSAQTYNITDIEHKAPPINGAYYKDLDNELDPFVGTYVYTYGTTSLKIVLQKKLMSDTGGYFEDMIVGEYQYIKDGVEKINTLPKLNQMVNHQRMRSIHGNNILIGTEMGCFDCSPTEKKLITGLVENSTKSWAQVSVRTTTVNGVDAIKIFVWWQMRTINANDPPLPNPSFPGGVYILIKQ